MEFHVSSGVSVAGFPVLEGHVNTAKVDSCALNLNRKPSSPPEEHRLWGTWGSYHNVPKAIFYLLEGIIDGGSQVDKAHSRLQPQI